MTTKIAIVGEGPDLEGEAKTKGGFDGHIKAGHRSKTAMTRDAPEATEVVAVMKGGNIAA